MTDVLPYRSTNPASPFPIAFDVGFFAGSVNPLHESRQCQQALLTARATEIKTSEN